MTTANRRPVALVGVSGAGKSTVGPLLARRLGGQAVDLDDRVEALAGCSISELFERRGEPEFRRLESAELVRAIDESPAVIVCGGGIVETPEARGRLREDCRGIWLEVAPDVAAARVSGSGAMRPLLTGIGPTAALIELLARRSPWYAEVAVARVHTDGLDAAEVASLVAVALDSTLDENHAS